MLPAHGSGRGDVEDPYGHQPADDLLYSKGRPPSGGTDTAERRAEKAESLDGLYHGATLPNEENVEVGAPGCQHCEVLPRPLRGPGTVLLRFGHTHTLGKALSFLAGSAWEYTEENGTVGVRVPAGDLAPLLSPILDLMTSVEERDTRVFFRPEGRLPGASDTFEVESLPEFVARSRSAWVLDLLREKLLYPVFQPLVRLSDLPGPGNGSKGGGPEVYGYECLTRATVDGGTASPSVMFDLARGAGFLFQMDLAARRAAIAGAAAHGIQQKVFVNFTPNSIYNARSCLNSTVRLVDDVGLERSQVVFEIVETERLPEIPHLKRIVEYYRERGFGVALDDVGTGFSSMEVLLALKPDYVKLDMSLTRGVDVDEDKAFVTGKLLELVRGLGLRAVAEGIETPGELGWVREQGVDLGQGFLFARAATPPPLS